MENTYWIELFERTLSLKGMPAATLNLRKSDLHSGLDLKDSQLREIPLISKRDLVVGKRNRLEETSMAQITLSEISKEIDEQKIPATTRVHPVLHKGRHTGNTLNILYGLTFFPFESSQEGSLRCVSFVGAHYFSRTHPKLGNFSAFFGEDIVAPKAPIQTNGASPYRLIGQSATEGSASEIIAGIRAMEMQRKYEEFEPEKIIDSSARAILRWYDKLL
jgi:hypothetical protein